VAIADAGTGIPGIVLVLCPVIRIGGGGDVFPLLRSAMPVSAGFGQPLRDRSRSAPVRKPGGVVGTLVDLFTGETGRPQKHDGDRRGPEPVNGIGGHVRGVYRGLTNRSIAFGAVRVGAPSSTDVDGARGAPTSERLERRTCG